MLDTHPPNFLKNLFNFIYFRQKYIPNVIGYASIVDNFGGKLSIITKIGILTMPPPIPPTLPNPIQVTILLFALFY